MAQPLRHELRAIERRFGQQQGEFLAADSGQDVGRPFASAGELSEMDDDPVAGLVAEFVIDCFEMIDVDHQE